MSDETTQTNQENLDTVGVKTDLEKEEEELKQYTQQRIAEILKVVMRNPNHRYRRIKPLPASWPWWQKRNHGNSKAQLHFDINAFYKDFDIKEKTWEDFVKIAWDKKISHDWSILTLENQESRHLDTNKQNVLNHLKAIIRELFTEEKERIQTEISREQKQERLEKKWKHSKKKERRKKIRPQDIE